MRILLLLSLLVPALSQANPYNPETDTLYYFVTSTQAGAQVQLDANHTSYWSFNPTASFWLGGGKFVLKDGSHTVGSSTFTVWQGPAGTGIFGDQLSLTHDQFVTLHTVPTSSYDVVPYLITPYLFVGGTSCTVGLTSDASAATSALQYFIKNTQADIRDGSGNILVQPEEFTYDGPPPLVPEPSTWVLMAGGLGLVAISRRYRQARSSR